MKVKSTKHLLTSVLVFAVAATTAQAQTAPKMKMTTEVPPSTKGIPPDCQYIVGSKYLTLDDMKDQLQLMESPLLSGTPGLDHVAKKFRDCIEKIERSSSKTR